VAALSAEVADQLGCQRPTVLVSERSRVPLLWGYFRPILLLPRAAESWDHDRLRVVITHEIAHLERGDWLTLLLGRIAVSVYWFHPLAWYLEQQARRDCEEACDDRVLATGTRASDYASHLLELSRGLQGGVAPQPAVALLRASQVEQRLRAILHPTRERRSPTRRFVGIAAGVLLLLLVPLASVRLEAWDPTPQRSSVLIGGSTTLDPLPISDWPDETDSGESLFEGAARVVHGQLAQVFHSPGDSWKVNRDRANRHPESGQEWFDLAYDYHNDERWEEAYQAFIEAANAGYRPGTSAYNAACGLARLGQTADALQWLERSLRDGFDSYDHLFEDSDLDSLRSDRSFRSLLDEYRSKAGSHWRLAQDRLEQAEGGYEKLVTSDHQDGDKWHEVGTDLLSLGEYDRAIESLQRSIELDPHQSSTTRYNLACAYARAGQTGNALDALDNAVEAGFGSDERFENDRDLDSIRGTPRFEEIRAKSEALSLDRFQYRGDNWFSRDSRNIDPARWNPAVEAYRPFVERYPNSGRGWFNLGYSLHYSGRHVEAIEAFDRALDLGFKPGQQMYNIACAHARLGNTDQALKWLKRSADSGWSIAHYLDDDKDLDSLRSDRRFQEFERAQWLESKRQSLMEHKRELEYKLRKFSESGKSDVEWKVQEAEKRAHEFRIQAELMERQRNASWLKADRERAIEAEQQAAKELERAQAEEQNAWREATTAELEQLKAKLAKEQAELRRRKAQLEAQLEDQAGGDVDLDPVVEAEQDN
jgi:tetratricopeptide (TPR) repeat protein